MQDLQPYICIFEECNLAEEMFCSTREWIEHMEKVHARQEWICSLCSTDRPCKFDTEEQLQSHLQVSSNHKGMLTKSQIPIIAKMSKRPRPLDLLCCPLCSCSAQSVSNQIQLQEHIAQCMHAFALRSLPWVDMGENYDSHSAVGDQTQHLSSSQTQSQQRSASTIATVSDRDHDSGYRVTIAVALPDGNEGFCARLDTGSDLNLISEDVARRLVKLEDLPRSDLKEPITTLSRFPVVPMGLMKLTFSISGLPQPFKARFYVIADHDVGEQFDGILGEKFIFKHDIHKLAKEFSSDAAMATKGQTTALPFSEQRIEIQDTEGYFVSKLALKTDNASDKNKVTVACVESLGFSANSDSGRRSTIVLNWHYFGSMKSYRDFFDIVEPVDNYDVILNDETVERILLSRSGAY